MRELVKSYEAWNPTSEKIDHVMIVWKENDNYYQSKHPETRATSFDLDSLSASIPIPMHIFKGHWHPSLTELPPVAPTDSFLKRPLILLEDYDDGQGGHDSRTPGDDLLNEAKVYEILKQHAHPNISIYYGCVRDGDCITAICLKKYGRTLMDAVWKKDPTLNPAAILDGISKGLAFLHETLGLVHNDINPANIMLDDAGDAVIIDFDSCKPIGEELGKAGTFTWTVEPMPTISLPENDLYGLAQIGEFMKGNRS
ncbi:kinase-like domain-containing protein [Suillus clintonianus]|uniref:kinase-like domain-containing protein n=1 Tax=Suillus clintonianus TaxID=1904413 RepID=UPI001B875FD3|nr:kinase-like domain-containing protein [Suillus clintonianus]KAG2135510.1 kinase-like domain-containing protein [Suillus clintonianus]